MSKFRRMMCFLLSVVAFACLLPLPGAAQEIALASEAAVLMDAESGQILYGKNMDSTMYPASITKVLTGLLALKYGKETDKVTMTQAGVSQVPRTSSHIALEPGEAFTMKDALYALALVSANDAAVAIAETVSGSVEDFAKLMNEEAEKLGAYNSHFVNPNGMPNQDHYTTARDMALITAEALKQEGFLTYFGAKSYEMPATNLSAARPLVSKNQFIDGTFDCPGLLMSKTGWTRSALGTLVTAVKRGDTTLIAVTLKSPMLEDKYTDTLALLDYGFANYRRVRLSQKLMERKMVAQGMDEDCSLEGYTPQDVLIPQTAGEADIAVTVPGGFDSSLGVSTVPASVDVKQEDGTWVHVTDLLLTIRDPEPEVEALAETEGAEAAAEPEAKAIHPGAAILLGLAVVFFLFRFIGKRKITA